MQTVDSAARRTRIAPTVPVGLTPKSQAAYSLWVRAGRRAVTSMRERAFAAGLDDEASLELAAAVGRRLYLEAHPKPELVEDHVVAGSDTGFDPHACRSLDDRAHHAAVGYLAGPVSDVARREVTSRRQLPPLRFTDHLVEVGPWTEEMRGGWGEQDEAAMDYLHALDQLRSSDCVARYDASLDAAPKEPSAFDSGQQREDALTQEEEALLSDMLAANGLDPEGEPKSLAERRAYTLALDEFRGELGAGLYVGRRLDAERRLRYLDGVIRKLQGQLRGSDDAVANRVRLGHLEVLKRHRAEVAAPVEMTTRKGARRPALVTFRDVEDVAHWQDIGPALRWRSHTAGSIEAIFAQRLNYEQLMLSRGREADVERIARRDYLGDPVEAQHDSDDVFFADVWQETVHGVDFDGNRVADPWVERHVRQLAVADVERRQLPVRDATTVTVQSRRPSGAQVAVGRGTRFGERYTGDPELYRVWLHTQIEKQRLSREALANLAGRELVIRPGDQHGEVLQRAIAWAAAR
jgi:hypothetical protein